MTAAALALAALAALQGVPAPAAVAGADAIAYFKRLCVDTLPDPGLFARALADAGEWEEYEPSASGPRIAGHLWRSRRGELGYQYIRGARPIETSPACHYSFRTAPGTGHAQLAAALASAFHLAAGRRTGGARAPQTRWEIRLENGTRAGVSLGSAIPGLGGPAARLTITAYPDAHPTE